MSDSFVKKVLFLIILFNPFLSLLFDNTSIHYHYLILPVIFLISLWISRKNKKDFFKLYIITLFTFISVSMAIILGGKIGKINNHLFNFLSFCSLMILFSNNSVLIEFKNFLLNKKRIIYFILFMINIVELYMLVTRKGFFYRFSWGGTFFRGTSSMPHTLSYLMLVTILYCLVGFCIFNDKKIMLFSLVPYLCIFESGARVSLILSAILGIIEIDFCFSDKDKSKIKRFFKLVIIVFVLFLIFKDKIMESDLMVKITKRSSSDDASAGRTVLWLDLMNRFVNTPSKWLLGFGDDKVYYYSGINRIIGESIWAHNDFVQTLFGKGILGISSYIISIITYIKSLLKNNGNYYSVFLIMFFFIAASLNGFYSYRDIMISIPFIYLLNIYLYNKKEVFKNEK